MNSAQWKQMLWCASCKQWNARVFSVRSVWKKDDCKWPKCRGSFAQNIFMASNDLKCISKRLPWTVLTVIPTRHKCSMSPQSQAPVDFQWSSSRNSLDDLHRLEPFFLLTTQHRNFCMFNSIHWAASTSGCCFQFLLALNVGGSMLYTMSKYNKTEYDTFSTVSYIFYC